MPIYDPTGVLFPVQSPEQLQKNAVEFGNKAVEARREQYFNSYTPSKAFTDTTEQFRPEVAALNKVDYNSPATEQQVQESKPNQPTESVSANQRSVPPAQAVQQQNQTGVVVDPGIETVKMQVNNRMSGVGDPLSGNVRPPPEVPIAKQMTQQMEDTGQRIWMDQSKIPKWNESDSFSYGLINFGLNLLSGNDLASSLDAASTKFTKMYGEEKRALWAEDLRKQGFDETEIQQYIKTGDSKDLTDPMEKKMKIMNYNLASATLDSKLYENSPEMRQYKADHQGWEDEMTVRKYQDDQSYRNAQLGLERARLALSQQEASDKRAAAKALNNGFGKMTEGDKRSVDLYNAGKGSMRLAYQLQKEGKLVLPDESSPMDMQIVEWVLEGKDPVKLAAARGLPIYGERINNLAKSVETFASAGIQSLYSKSGANFTAKEYMNVVKKMQSPNDTPEVAARKQTNAVLEQLSIHPQYRLMLPELTQHVDRAFIDESTGQYIIKTKDGKFIKID